jgi:hypothetical protein
VKNFSETARACAESQRRFVDARAFGAESLETDINDGKPLRALAARTRH